MKKLAILSFLILMAGLVLPGCMPLTFDIPDTVKIEDGYTTQVAKTTNIHGQTLYENQKLTHYVVNNNHVYCSDLISKDYNKPRCFKLNNGDLIEGMHPLTYKFSPLNTKVPIKKSNE